MNVLVGTKQFKMLLEEEFVERLKSLAQKTGRDSAQHLAEEILTIYLPVYVAVNEATRRAIDVQTTVIATGGKRTRVPDVSKRQTIGVLKEKAK